MCFEYTLTGDVTEINRKLRKGIRAVCPMTTVRDSWDTTVAGVRCIVTVFEQHASKSYTDGEWKDEPHYSLTLTLLESGSKIRLCAITAGGSQDMYFIPYSRGEEALLGALQVSLEILDQIK